MLCRHRHNIHKIRNVRDRLPEQVRIVVDKRMREAYHAESVLVAQAQLESLAAELDKTHPGAAASLREGLQATLDRAAPQRAAHAGQVAAQHELHRIDDRDLP